MKNNDELMNEYFTFRKQKQIENYILDLEILGKNYTLDSKLYELNFFIENTENIDDEETIINNKFYKEVKTFLLQEEIKKSLKETTETKKVSI